MKKDLVYPYYLCYLDWRLFEKEISKGSRSLLKISKSAFDDFKYRFENDELFHSRVIELHKAETRDKKIDDIFDDLD